MVRLIAAMVILLGLSACATTERFTQIMNSYMGGSEPYLIQRLGLPSNSYTMANGSRVLQFSRSANLQLGGNYVNQPVTTTTTATAYGNRIGTVNAYGTSTTYVPVQQPIYNVPLSCTINITLDSSGLAQDWNATGNHCVAR